MTSLQVEEPSNPPESVENQASVDEDLYLPSTSKQGVANKKPRKQKVLESDSESESDGYSVQDDSSDSPEIFEQDESEDTAELGVNDFVLVEFLYQAPGKKSTQKKFIGQIKEIKENSIFLCSFLRKSSSGRNIYVFPNIPDIGDVEQSHILTRLKPQFIKRGRHLFAVEL